MSRMFTRSSSRQSQTSEINSKTKNLRTSFQTRDPKSDFYFSDDSEEESGKLTHSKLPSSKNKNKSLKTNKRLSKYQNNGIDMKERNRARRATKPCIGLSDESDEEYKNLNNTPPKLSTPRKQKLRNTDIDLDHISCVSPPKQKKINGENLPQTPPKIELNKEVQTPSSLLLKLKLTSPTHSNTTVVGKLGSNRKQLFKEDNEKNGLDESEKRLNKNTNVYQNARKALHSTSVTEMPGRETELIDLKDFIKKRIQTRTSGSLYVSGPPGTGKTASLNMILQEDDISSELKKVYVNCTAIKSPTVIYSRIAKELDIKVNGKAEKDYLTGVENYLKKQNKMILLVLDEIDQLENKNQSILYTIFEWPSKPNSHLILVGIANALDLTDRILPRLQARCELKPKLMHFAPYTKQQIVQIFTSRLKAAGVLDVFSPIALQMLAGKVAAVSGDVRRALDIGRRVIELVDQGKKEDVLKPIQNLANELVDKEKSRNDEKPKTVELKQVVSVLNNVYGTSQNLTDETEDTFPLQQKIIICSLVLMLKKARNKDVTVGKLHEVYKRVCSKRNILSVDQAEFVGLCSLIETRGIIRVAGRKEPRLHKVNLEWDEEEVAAALKDKQLMSMILQDDNCLGKM